MPPCTMQKIHYSDKEYEQVLLTLGEVTEALHNIENEETKEMVMTLMQHFDVLHREAISRLWSALEFRQPEFCEKVIKDDYAVRNLLALYDLIEFEGIKKPVEPPIFIPLEQVTILKY